VTGPTGRIAVIGAGLAGLSTAMRLVGAGREVTVFEQAAEPGGRAGALTLEGYQFDTGPTVLTMPELIDDAFAALGEQRADWLELLPVNPLYRALFPDGSRLDVLAGLEPMAAEIDRVCGAHEAAGYRRFVAFVSELYRLEMRHFIDRNLDSPLDLVHPSLAKLVALGGMRRLAPKVGQYLKDDRTQRLFSFQAMYAGLSPYDALAIYSVIAYMDSVAGVFYPQGGMAQLARAMAAAATKHGGTFRYNTGVERVELSGDRAVAVITKAGERHPCDAVVITADLPLAYRELLGPDRTPKRIKKLTYSPSCFLLLAGSRQTYPAAAHHTISFGRAWRQTFNEVIDQGTLMSDPSLLVTNATRTDPTLAPPGKQSYYVLAPTPNLSAPLDWSVLAPRYRDELVQTLEARGFTGFGDGIEVEQVTTPADWRTRGMEQGAPFAAAHSFRQTGPFRPANLAPGLDNVVFAGSGTQPGVGIPMVLISGRLAAQRILG
jgi:phytoene desaturase